MSKPKLEAQRNREPAAVAAGLPAGIITASVCGLAAAWVAAGSIGLAGHALRHALMWVLLTAAVASAWPKRRTPSEILLVVLALAAALVMAASSLQAVNVLAVAVALAALAVGRAGADRKTLVVSAQAVAVFALYRIVITSVPAAWVVADTAGASLGRAAGTIAGPKLSVGPSFAGLDFLVLMAALAGLWLAATPGPRLVRGLAGAVAILAGHAIYLIILAFAQGLADLIPAAAASATPASPFEHPWSFWAAVKTLLPWSLPAVAGLIQTVVACGVLRWAPPPVPAEAGGRAGRILGISLSAAAVLAAAALAVATSLYGPPEGLAGKKIVVNEKGFLNWLRPTHGEYGRLAIGMYGMLGDFVESLGGKLVRTTEFSDEDLKDASAVILIFPNKPWAPGQLERIWKFVQDGGSLLVMGEHTIREEDGGARFNDALAPTKIRVQFDSAQWAVGGWLGCYETPAHPITLGHRGERNDLGVVIGASVDARWPARPVILGRWGWSDWGDEGSPRAMMGNDRVDPGERLGDVILAAEQRLGRGKVLVFGDTSSLTNGINIGVHPFTSALLAYVAGPASEPAPWREIVALAAAAAVAVLLLLRAPPWRVIAVGAAGGLALWICTAWTHRANVSFPDGNVRQPNFLAYIDASHLEAYSPESLRDDGIMGLEYTLMRSGFLTLALSDFQAAALDRAAVLVSIAPSRPFSAGEREAVKRFVEGGGVFIVTAGYDQSAAVAPLLAEFGLRVGDPAGPNVEPRPLGHFKSRYVNIEGRMHYVRYHAAWSVAEDSSVPGPRGGQLERAKPVALGLRAPGDEVPVILMRPWGKGKVFVVGDTGFAMNKNLENVDGSPFEGMRENADFWRWFLGQYAGRPPWMPPEPETTPAEPGAAPAPASAAPPAEGQP
ncbi:MAG: hypothetical protein NTU94_11740 [Planctomycetota bacterium]|nr:hypothetical protein [Planctomycetota bacterium]